MRKVRRAGFVVLVGMAGCGWGRTPDAAGPFHGVFVQVDLDGDGFISEPELRQRVIDETRMDMLDRNGDGRVSEGELTSRLFSVDPSHFDTTLDPVVGEVGRAGVRRPSESARQLRELYYALYAEIIAAGGDPSTVPALVQLDAAAAAGDVTAAPEVRHRLLAGAHAAGLVLPLRLERLLAAS